MCLIIYSPVNKSHQDTTLNCIACYSVKRFYFRTLMCLLHIKGFSYLFATLSFDLLRSVNRVVSQLTSELVRFPSTQVFWYLSLNFLFLMVQLKKNYMRDSQVLTVSYLVPYIPTGHRGTEKRTRRKLLGRQRFSCLGSCSSAMRSKQWKDLQCVNYLGCLITLCTVPLRTTIFTAAEVTAVISSKLLHITSFAAC